MAQGLDSELPMQGRGSIPGWGTRSHMAQPRIWCSLIN